MTPAVDLTVIAADMILRWIVLYGLTAMIAAVAVAVVWVPVLLWMGRRLMGR